MVRPPARIHQILQQFETLWRQYPDLPFGRLMTTQIDAGGRFFALEDAELSTLLDEAIVRGRQVKFFLRPSDYGKGY